MGTSGPGIFADDVAADVRDEYLSMLAEGCTDKQAVQTILAEWEESIADDDEGPVVWLALAATQWEYGRLDAQVKRRALQVIDAGEDHHRWLGTPHEKRRKQILQRLRTKLASQQPKRRKPRQKKIDIRAGDVIEFPLASDLRAYARIYEACGYGLYKFVASERPSDISIIIAAGIASLHQVGEYQSEKGKWPRVGSHAFSPEESLYIPPRRLEGIRGRFTVLEEGEYRDATASDVKLPLIRRTGEDGFIAEARETLRGERIWPTDELFDPSVHPPPPLFEEQRLSMEELASMADVKKNLLLILAALNDEIMMPSLRAVRSLVNQLCKCELGTPPSTKFALFRRCVEKLNKFELIDTSDGEILFDLLYRIGELSDLPSESKYLDRWRQF